jgi:sulfur-oxidizing protein SoxA
LNRFLAPAAIAATAAMAVSVISMTVLAAPADDALVIDGELEMTTRTSSVEGHPLPEVISGWHYRTDDTRVLQQDSFDNPGMLGIDEGEVYWNKVEGTEGKSCASCHDDASVSMAGVGSSYPKWSEKLGKPINVELQINDCRVDKMGAEPYKFDKGGQKPLTAYIKHQSLGEPVALNLEEGEMNKWWERGKETYYKRTGQLNLSCATCHEDNNGKYIRADHLSQGNVNGFPTYRLKQSNLISLHNRFRGCIRDTRAEYPAAFSDELMGLEVYTTWRGTGLSVETPAVRQ